jgi:hypothetical protein
MVGGPGVKPGFAASDATVLFSYTTHPICSAFSLLFQTPPFDVLARNCTTYAELRAGYC